MRLHPCPLPLLSLLALGCAGGSSGPLTPAPEHPGPGATGWASAGQASLGQPLIRGDLAESALAIFTVHIDPTVPSATVELTNARNAQATDDIYELSIE
ncbi:MAG TPA: hypothetical protein VEI97_20205, partial [bacterium]|nr:hypothetical protein [bacterium]